MPIDSRTEPENYKKKKKNSQLLIPLQSPHSVGGKKGNSQNGATAAKFGLPLVLPPSLLLSERVNRKKGATKTTTTTCRHKLRHMATFDSPATPPPSPKRTRSNPRRRKQNYNTNHRAARRDEMKQYCSPTRYTPTRYIRSSMHTVCLPRRPDPSATKELLTLCHKRGRDI